MRNTILTMTAAVIASIAGMAGAEQAITSFELDNGMQVVVIEDHRAPAVSHMIWYKVGAADEPPGQSGIAHFVEHLMFRGTETYALGEFQRTVESLGGSENGFTSRDYSGYFQRIAADRLETVMELEADRMTGLLMTEEDVETERQVVLEERNERTDTNPHALFSEQRSAALYLNHPYGIPTIGWKHEIESVTREQLFNFYRKHYVPNNAILIVAGDTDPEEVRRLAEKHYGGIARGPDVKPRARPQEPTHLAARRLSATDPRVAQPYLVRLYLAPERNSSDQESAAALQILAEILGGGLTSVLTRKLQIEQGIAVDTGAFYSGASVDPTSFGLITVPADGTSLEDAELAMDQAIEEFLEEGVDPDQLNRIKSQMRAAWIYAQDNVHDQARRYGHELTIGLTLEDVTSWPDVLNSVTGDDVLAAAKQVFDIRNSVTGYLSGEEVQ